MTKKCTKKKLKESGVDSDVEIIYGTRIETRFEDTKAIMGISPEFKSGELYQMIRDQKIPDAGLKEMVLYQNIRRQNITKVSMFLDFFSCSKRVKLKLPQLMHIWGPFHRPTTRPIFQPHLYKGYASLILLGCQGFHLHF